MHKGAFYERFTSNLRYNSKLSLRYSTQTYSEKVAKMMSESSKFALPEERASEPPVGKQFDPVKLRQHKTVALNCNCMASRHTLTSSCTGCGWICCEENCTLITCPHCSSDLLPPMSADELQATLQSSGQSIDESKLAAYRLKDKLLQFDKENAKRTHVHDAQGDYYESSTWLTEEEKADIDRREARRRQQRLEQQRKSGRRKVNIRFDIAGRRIVDYEVEEEGEEVEGGQDADGEYEFTGGEQHESGNATVEVDFLAYRDDLPGAATHGAINRVDYLQSVQKTSPSPSIQSERPNVSQTASSAESTAKQPSTADGNGDSFDDTCVSTLAYENVGLELSAGKAGEVYRAMKKR